MADENHMLKVPIKYKLDPSVPVNQQHVIICEDLLDLKVVDTGFRYISEEVFFLKKYILYHQEVSNECVGC